jgi:Lrp/AsnC family transcriptional regulator for asnA, asnC and gidA
MKYEIDKIDLDILKNLSSNAKISFTDLASKILVSPSTVHVRVKKMEDAGIIKNFTININYSMLGYTFTAYLGVFLDNSNTYGEVVSKLKLIPQITVIDFTTGPFSIFCKIRSRDSESARDVLIRIQSIVGIQRTETFLSMDEIINEKNSLISSINL